MRRRKLAFARRAYDFGRVAQGAPVEHRFTFANDGGTDLTIIDLRAACDCAATLEGGRDVAPAGARRGARRASRPTRSTAPQRRTITVYSNDPQQRAIMLTITGDVALEVAADPPQVYLGVVPPGVRSGCAVWRCAPATTACASAHRRSDAPQLALRLGDAADGSDAAAVLAIGTSPAAPLGPFSAVVACRRPARRTRCCASPSAASSTRPRRRRARLGRNRHRTTPHRRRRTGSGVSVRRCAPTRASTSSASASTPRPRLRRAAPAARRRRNSALHAYAQMPGGQVPDGAGRAAVVGAAHRVRRPVRRRRGRRAAARRARRGGHRPARRDARARASAARRR